MRISVRLNRPTYIHIFITTNHSNYGRKRRWVPLKVIPCIYMKQVSITHILTSFAYYLFLISSFHICFSRDKTDLGMDLYSQSFCFHLSCQLPQIIFIVSIIGLTSTPICFHRFKSILNSLAIRYMFTICLNYCQLKTTEYIFWLGPYITSISFDCIVPPSFKPQNVH